MERVMEQTISASWTELFGAMSVLVILMIGGVWAVVGFFLKNLSRAYRVMRSQADGVRMTVDDLAIALGKVNNDIDHLRREVNAVSNNIDRIVAFLAQLAGTPPSFPSDLHT
jgi:hypothetical protein